MKIKKIFSKIIITTIFIFVFMISYQSSEVVVADSCPVVDEAFCSANCSAYFPTVICPPGQKNVPKNGKNRCVDNSIFRFFKF